MKASSKTEEFKPVGNQKPPGVNEFLEFMDIKLTEIYSHKAKRQELIAGGQLPIREIAGVRALLAEIIGQIAVFITQINALNMPDVAAITKSYTFTLSLICKAVERELQSLEAVADKIVNQEHYLVHHFETLRTRLLVFTIAEAAYTMNLSILDYCNSTGNQA